jgi:hypothetical protein
MSLVGQNVSVEIRMSKGTPNLGSPPSPPESGSLHSRADRHHSPPSGGGPPIARQTHGEAELRLRPDPVPSE